MDRRERGPLLERLLLGNRRAVARGPALPQGSAPSERLAIVTCMDVRIDPLALLGLGPGQAHVLRNAGGRVTDDVLRSLVISQQALGTRAVVLMPHTQCGTLGLDVRALTPRPGVPAAAVPPLDFHPMADLEEALRGDLRLLRESPWLHPETELVGLILDIATGRVRSLGA